MNFALNAFRAISRNQALAPAPAGGSWTTVLDNTAFALPTNDTGWNGYTWVLVVPKARLSQTGGTQIRITFKTHSTTEGSEWSAVYVGNGGGGDAYDFGDTPVRLQASGSNTITVAAGGTLTTDGANFVKDGTNPLIVSMQWQNGAKDNTIRDATEFTGANIDNYYKAASAEAATQDKSGYTANTGTKGYAISKIELFI